MGEVIEIGKGKPTKAWQNLDTQFRGNLQPGDIFQMREDIRIPQGHWCIEDKMGTLGCVEYANEQEIYWNNMKTDSFLFTL